MRIAIVILLFVLSFIGCPRPSTNKPLTIVNLSNPPQIENQDKALGVTKDSTTGLMWMKCPQGMFYNLAAKTCTGSPLAFRYCNTNDDSCNNEFTGEELNGMGNSPAWDTCNKLVYAGHYDWRVPSKNELKSLIKCTDGIIPADGKDCGEGNYTSPTINSALFTHFPSTWFWTSSSDPNDSSNAWHIDFSRGGVGNYDRAFRYYKVDSAAIICVR